MAMCRALEKHGFLLVKKEEEKLYEIVDAALSIAPWRNPKELQKRRGGIAKNLFSLPEDVIGSCYEKSHCTVENATTGSALETDSVPQNLNSTGSNSPKKNPKKVKISIKPYIPTSTNSKLDEKKKVNEKFVASEIAKDKKKNGDHSFGVSMAKPSSKSKASNVKSEVTKIDGALLDEKFESSKRKLEQRYKQLGEGVRKTQVLDFAEMKDLIKPSRDVKRPRFRR